mgnify:CR=1 FL=1
MKKLAVFALLVLSSSAILPTKAGAQLAVSTTTTQDVWPDYKSGKWVEIGRKMLLINELVTFEKNDYIVGSGKFQFNVGMISTFLNSAENPTMAVSEFEILDAGVVMKIRYNVLDGAAAIAAWQFKVDGEWWSPDLYGEVEIHVKDPELLVKENKLSSVILTYTADEFVVMKLVIENKTPVKSGK